MSEKLKPCPFCGCEDIEHVRANNSLDFSMRIDEDRLICKKCAHAMSDKSAIKLINKWNSRPIEDKFRAWLDRLTAHRKELVNRNVFLHEELKKYKRLNTELVEALKEAKELVEELRDRRTGTDTPYKIKYIYDGLDIINKALAKTKGEA